MATDSSKDSTPETTTDDSDVTSDAEPAAPHSDEVELTGSATFNPETEDSLLGGLDFETTSQISVPDNLIDQVIGQEHAREAVRKAAAQRRHVMMIGPPGTGKSMLAKAMTELLPEEQTEDILVRPNPDDENTPRIETYDAGEGKRRLEQAKQRAKQKESQSDVIILFIILAIIGYAVLVGDLLLGFLAAGVIYLVYHFGYRTKTEIQTPNLLIDASDYDQAPFENATGAHDGALLGDVRHDPYQSGGMGTPAHERVEPGAIHKANKGVLFIDEINTLDIRSQQKLMTAIQEGKFSITGQSERSSGAMVQTEPVPCDFIMVAAGNLDAMENMHPALRNRIKGYGYEVYMDDTIEDTPEMRRKYVRFVAQEVAKDANVPEFTADAVKEVIREARREAGRQQHLTLSLRQLGGLVRIAGDIARANDRGVTTREHVLAAKDRSRSIEQQLADKMIERKEEYDVTQTEKAAIGRVNGLAVYGDDSGIVLPVMSSVVPAHGEGDVIATGNLQEIAQEAVRNVSAIIKKFSDEDLSEKDVHIQYVQSHEGVEGDSASITMATAVISALEGVPVDQSVAMTGSLSVRGDVLPVGGVTHKIEAAAKAGIETVIIPKANKQDVMIEDEYKQQVEIVPVSHLGEVLEVAIPATQTDTENSDSVLSRLRETLRVREWHPDLTDPMPSSASNSGS